MLRNQFAFGLVIALSFPSWAEDPQDAQNQKTKQPDRPASVLELIPEQAIGVIATRDLSALIKRGDELIAKTEMKQGFRLSTGFDLLMGFVGVRDGVDRKGSVALMAFGTEGELEKLALLVPIKDLKGIAAGFNLPPESFVEGKVLSEKNKSNTRFHMALYRNHLILALEPEVAQLIIEGKKINTLLAADTVETLQQDDVIVYVNKTVASQMVESMLKGTTSGMDAADDEVLQQLGSSIEELKSIVLGIRLDGGVGGTMTMAFDGKNSRTLLGQLQAEKPTSLAGLPSGKLLAAHASSGDGDRTATLARAALNVALKWMNRTSSDGSFSATDSANVFAVLGESWQRADGLRTAVYETDNPQMHGGFCVAAILKTDAPDEFVTSMTSLLPFMNASRLTAEEAAKAIDKDTIAELIDGLGNRRYRVRQASAVKLGLIGVPAHDALKIATKSGDYEIRTRAAAILRDFESTSALENKQLLNGKLLNIVKPKFAFAPNQEQRGGVSVDFLHVQNANGRPELAKQLKSLFGEEWKTLRMAIVGDNVLLFMGSDLNMFDKLVDSVRDDTTLIASKSIGRFRERSDKGFNAEFHLALDRILDITGTAAKDQQPQKPKPQAAPQATTSLGVRIEPQRVRIDLFAPFEEAKHIVKRAF